MFGCMLIVISQSQKIEFYSELLVCPTKVTYILNVPSSDTYRHQCKTLLAPLHVAKLKVIKTYHFKGT